MVCAECLLVLKGIVPDTTECQQCSADISFGSSAAEAHAHLEVHNLNIMLKEQRSSGVSELHSSFKHMLETLGFQQATYIQWEPKAVQQLWSLL